MSRLSPRVLNRTLLRRQHLLERVPMTPLAMVEHLVGLQAQENLPPYLSLAARLTDFDPHEISRMLDERRLVRILSLRDTVHLHVPADAVTLPVFAAPVREREERISQAIGAAREVDRDAFSAALAEILTEPMPQRRLSAALAERFPEHPAAALGQVARVRAILVQAPPRGGWRSGGGVVYEYADRWTGLPTQPPDLPALVRRYLRAFGPASAADMTAWSSVTRLGPVLAGMDDLVRHQPEEGRVVLYDVPEGVLEPEETAAPVRLLGTYDNVWLAHAGRDRVTDPAHRASFLNTPVHALMADGMVVGLWRPVEERVEVISTTRPLTRSEQAELDEEIARVEDLLAR